MAGNGRVSGLADLIAEEIRSGKSGVSGDRFLTARELSAKYVLSPENACKLLSELSERHLLRLDGKNYYITTGRAAIGSPYEKRLSVSRRNFFGLILNTIDNPFFSSLAKELSVACDNAGYRLLISSARGDARLETGILDEFLELGASGIFTCPGMDAELVEIYSSCPLPVVSLGHDIGIPDCDTVLVDNYSAGAQVASHLLEIGCTRFAYVGIRDVIGDDPRINGFSDRLSKAGHGLSDDCVITAERLPDGWHDPESIAGSLGNLLHRLPEGEKLGIFCYHDLLAVETQRFVKHWKAGRRMRIPDDVAIVGFDDLPVTSEVTPQITSVSYRFVSMAKKSVGLMLDMLSDPAHKAGRYEISSSLRVRESTRVVRETRME